MSSETTQYGFFFDQSRCDGCRTCVAACKTWNGLPAGPLRWARMYQWETGTFPAVRLNQLFAPCYHCEKPVCVTAANGAMFKEAKYGAVLIDPAQATSANLRAAWEACPYGAISFDSDSPDASASKCTMCVDRLEQGKLPICVQSCPMRALDFGKLSDLQAKYGKTSDLPDVPSSATTSPAVVFKPHDTKPQLVPLDSGRVLQTMATRKSGLPAVYSQPSDVTDIPSGLMTKNALNMKAGSTTQFEKLLADDNS
jgi:anaerobic dimethyl sulfoxide reductase subunit B (iron-sulfur subunit)